MALNNFKLSARKTQAKLGIQNLSNFTQQYRNPIKGFHFKKRYLINNAKK